ncbi:MAG: type II toxin-antitoxin system RelE/ParE family toxin [Agathobacter sp.]|jgi:addiction module RelE/StbE family toxin|nr:type II toxin-antitoxin system RelE/ParE family toxin [uncultured Ruminococcus sp.]MEE1035124.1 type II toxin-antitoxin system RelE/ParE family toxin [Agathobacter sp.]
MATVLFSPEALNDLEEIKSYIQDDLENDIAAANTLKKIFDRILELESFPKMGALLNSVTNTDNSYRYLLCNNYTAFYRIEKDSVYIVRVLYGRRDYLRILFE